MKDTFIFIIFNIAKDKAHRELYEWAHKFLLVPGYNGVMVSCRIIRIGILRKSVVGNPLCKPSAGKLIVTIL